MTTAYASLAEAMMGRLRAMPTIVAAFGEDESARRTTKFWADFAESGVDLPWAVYEEIEGDIQYMTAAGGHVASIESGSIRWLIAGEGRKAVRDLGKMVVTVLNDAPLLFTDGQLMDLRIRKPFFVPAQNFAPTVPHAAVRMLIFDYMLSRTT